MKEILSSAPLNQKALAIIRIVFGVLLIIHGTQAFYRAEMSNYEPWLRDLGVPIPLVAAYLGKICEFIGGLLLVLGVFTRIACTLLMMTFLFITVVMADGKIFTDGQHPFLFFLISAIFFFAGAGVWTVKGVTSRK